MYWRFSASFLGIFGDLTIYYIYYIYMDHIQLYICIYNIYILYEIGTLKQHTNSF
jgi:hypothetical protein